MDEEGKNALAISPDPPSDGDPGLPERLLSPHEPSPPTDRANRCPSPEPFLTEGKITTVDAMLHVFVRMCFHVWPFQNKQEILETDVLLTWRRPEYVVLFIVSDLEFCSTSFVVVIRVCVYVCMCLFV